MDHPLSTLLARRRKRHPESSRAWWLALGLASLALTSPTLPSELVALASVILVAAYPVAVACRNAALLGSLHQGGCLDELLGTPTRPSEWLDDLAFGSAREVLSSWRWLTPLWWLWGLLVWHLGPLALAVPPLGLALQASAAWLASYAAAAGQIWSAGEDDLAPRVVLMALGLTPGLTSLVLPLGLGLAPVWPLSLSLMLAPWRAAGVWGLSAAPALTSRAQQLWQGLVARGGNPWTILPWQQNAIVYRESRSEAHRIPGRLPGLLLWRHGPGLAITFALALSIAHANRPMFWLGLVVLLLVETLQAAYRTVSSLVVEREANTLESLLATPLSTRHWVDGWAAVGFVPRLVDMALVGPVLVMMGWTVDLGWLRGALGATVIAVLATAASYAGILASARSSSRGKAHDLVGLELCARLWGVGILALLLTLVLPTPLAALPVLLTGALVWWLRRACLSQLSLTPALSISLLRQALRWAAPLGFVRRLLARLERDGLVAGPEPGLGPTLSLALGCKAPDGFAARLLTRLEDQTT
ncbi:hypothetical protein DYH09_30760 [bacterium CPR1]|nr:hypothetical protein [bacterium CPR1]